MVIGTLGNIILLQTEDEATCGGPRKTCAMQVAADLKAKLQIQTLMILR
jgi:hypothetical protein